MYYYDIILSNIVIIIINIYSLFVDAATIKIL